jgi:hypothetical protein
MPSKYPISRDLSKSSFSAHRLINGKWYEFRFSTEFNKTKFSDGYEAYCAENRAKIYAKYQLDAGNELFLAMAWYKFCERRGLYVLSGNEVIDEWQQVTFDTVLSTRVY